MKSRALILLLGGAGSLASQGSVHVEQSIDASNGSTSPMRGPLARSSMYIPFCGGQKRATSAQVAYVGNTGTEEHYGCNMMQIPANIASLYKYTIEFINSGYTVQQCKCWNKIGPDGGINGFFAGNEAITFSLAASGQQLVAFDENSQIGCACHAGSIPLTPFGEFASTWVEADFGNELNQKHSGFDASCLVAAKHGLDIPGLSVCGGSQNTCSTIFPGGAGENAYVKGMEDLNIVAPIDPGPVALTVKVDIV
ncbi:allergen Asp F4-like protein [Cordyceps fumosorosea ARSEF 2679]|uniref:Allergen Asp F4-like protein n=1 Tax=Cordyceps fumosorosea (strain ARSEF 2679) TaxID=1081104 RepID=A0A167EVD5_CORFA|nr:allergen Asp F4-like protein [Cordyceps fumosorosea ARSEF 2679]OAA44442.1 allergen Asp F4-like protein [Cordyceps fumosorosea ARSEF 2679]